MIDNDLVTILVRPGYITIVCTHPDCIVENIIKSFEEDTKYSVIEGVIADHFKSKEHH